MGHFPNDKNLSQTLIPSQELSIVLSRLDPVQQPCAYKCGLWSSDCLGSKSWLCHLQAEIMLVKHSSSVWHIRGVCQMSDISIITAFQLGFLVHISLYFLTIAQILGFFKLMLFPFLECRFFFDWKFHFFFFFFLRPAQIYPLGDTFTHLASANSCFLLCASTDLELSILYLHITCPSCLQKFLAQCLAYC